MKSKAVDILKGDWRSTDLKIDHLEPGAGATIIFEAVSNRTCSVPYTDDPGSRIWTKLADVVARGTNRIEHVTDATTTDKRYYRLVTPRQGE